MVWDIPAAANAGHGHRFGAFIKKQRATTAEIEEAVRECARHHTSLGSFGEDVCFSISDYFDWLCTERSYRPGFSFVVTTDRTIRNSLGVCSFIFVYTDSVIFSQVYVGQRCRMVGLMYYNLDC